MTASRSSSSWSPCCYQAKAHSPDADTIITPRLPRTTRRSLAPQPTSPSKSARRLLRHESTQRSCLDLRRYRRPPWGRTMACRAGFGPPVALTSRRTRLRIRTTGCEDHYASSRTYHFRVVVNELESPRHVSATWHRVDEFSCTSLCIERHNRYLVEDRPPGLVRVGPVGSWGPVVFASETHGGVRKTPVLGNRNL